MNPLALRAPDYFDQCYRHDDPFGYRSLWYERRKRDILLSCLDRPRYAEAWEPGCSNGELTVLLAERCERLLATDVSARAVQIASRRNAANQGVQVRRAEHPGDWPGQRFDLIVFSELGYYLDAATLGQTAQRLAGSLADGGLLLACHWLAPFAEAPTSAHEVHQRLAAALDRPCTLHYTDGDFLLQGWSDAPLSVAQREGLR